MNLWDRAAGPSSLGLSEQSACQNIVNNPYILRSPRVEAGMIKAYAFPLAENCHSTTRRGPAALCQDTTRKQCFLPACQLAGLSASCWTFVASYPMEFELLGGKAISTVRPDLSCCFWLVMMLSSTRSRTARLLRACECELVQHTLRSASEAPEDMSYPRVRHASGIQPVYHQAPRHAGHGQS